MASTVPYDTYDYPGWWKGREFEHKAESIAINRLLSDVPQRKSILDIGAGFGRIVPVYAPFFSKIVLFDSSEKLLAIAREYLHEYRGISYIKGNVESLPFVSNSFDVVLTVRVFHHFTEHDKLISEAARVIKNNGYLIVEFANKVHFSAVVRALLHGQLSFLKDTTPYDRDTRHEDVKFLNHHPNAILRLLEDNGFEIFKILSVSNLRYKLLKKLFPIGLLLFLEERMQEPFARIKFGPSIFILAQKKSNRIVRNL